MLLTSDKNVRTANEVSRDATDVLADSVREESKRVWMKPIEQVDFADIQSHLQQAAKANHITLIALADKVYAKLKADTSDDSAEAAWFKGAFGIRD